MTFLDTLVSKIKEQYGNQIYESQIGTFYDSYLNYYTENVSPQPKLGFVAVVGWNNDRLKEFKKHLKYNGISVLEDVAEPLHSYILKNSGLDRLSELERKLVVK